LLKFNDNTIKTKTTTCTITTGINRCIDNSWPQFRTPSL